ncbi:alpha/beta hydrolase [Streptomyces sp. b94]|uniref:alpha/beta fold hydrolase n=1 Tax=Streptomyces sp. b94 TaxID=1827634 RepID=UPI001B35BC52|nr:alpha/beta hydrolase [Streptomyces sp. b94]MBQ1098236.1 alpha/beta hydrolase [Streptomyces sp. b94]
MSEEKLVERRVLVNGVSTLYYETGTGPVVLLLSGIGEDARSWRKVMQDLALTHRVLVLVLPGLGGTSPVDDLRPGPLASFAAAFLDSLEVPAGIVVGHSYGGAVAAYMALEHPQRVTRLVLVDSAGLGRAINPLLIALGNLPAPAANLLATTATLPGVGALGALAGNLLLRQPWRVPLQVLIAQVRLSRTRVSVRTSIEMLRLGTELTGQKRKYLVLGRLKNIAVPTMIVWGLTDMLLPVSQGVRAARRLRNGRLEVIRNGGHVCFLDSHEDFMAALSPFVRDDIDRLRK